ncbi:hypothetical protein Y1Q_0007197 [Alligator mississippiensis]|uniref:Uncharacterized protein n=1 Tax=Alligator mississippiensis TaxID=8496 RepID=A0A151N5W3_ALLMI|nr:hypothetical protein Y1Q_0007197 [Alligator mississippiensis]
MHGSWQSQIPREQLTSSTAYAVLLASDLRPPFCPGVWFAHACVQLCPTEIGCAAKKANANRTTCFRARRCPFTPTESG